MAIISKKRAVQVEATKLSDAIAYIDAYWAKLTREQHQDKGTLIGLPEPYVVPSVGSENFQFEEQYYWDSYFTMLGLDPKKHRALIEGMLENYFALLDRFGQIPNASRMYMLSRSQPPFLTSYIFHVYEIYEKSNDWLQAGIARAKVEYQSVWMGTHHPHWRNVHQGLSRYYDINMLHDLAEAESGWDMTTRFQRKCLDFLPVDLNSLLYKYETDFARAAEIDGDPSERDRWLKVAEARAAAMTKLMWRESKGMYFDYNYNERKHGSVWSLAAFYPLWAGLATPEQAAKLVKNLPKFERQGGLTTTTKPLVDLSIFGSLKTQWAYPNGWAPLHIIVIDGLEKYGYHKDAERLAKKWLATNLNWFEKHGVFLEKYNVVVPDKHPLEGVYPSQTGFGWTNGALVYLAYKYSEK